MQPGMMQPHPRYELLGLIGNGDFAAVYRARDRELGRDVAIKQIHGQYLHDPRRLERFWREAQLLAALAHPHIMTIYDIDRPRGWLVLELMRGTLLDASQGEPIDLGLLRSSLVGSLQALSMLHGQKVIHGDIKPSNLMLDRLGQIKLGDFGLARRVASDQGSYLKGATRYMAPELVAPQFGAVGPPSDLYSLGFSAYELLCGPQQFENLFPGLDAFGRDRQIAWMMWHAAPDRRLPPVASVLDGVPDDLARVIDRLTIKDPAKRYQSADHALAELGSQQAVSLPADDEEAEEAVLAKRQQFQRRLVAGMALLASALVSVLIAVMPGKSTPPPAPDPIAVRGVVRTLLPERQLMIVEQANDLGPKEVVVRGGDRVYLNDKASLLRELRESDQVTIETLRDEQGRPFQEIQASRPYASSGTIAAVKADVGELLVTVEEGNEIKLAVGPKVPIELNGSSQGSGRPLALIDLAAGDRVMIEHFRDRGIETAIKIIAARIVEGQGVVRAIDLKKGEVTIAESEEDGAATKAWKLAPQVEVTLNNRGVLDDRLLTPADLRPGDRIRFQRDARLVRIDARRQFEDRGIIQAIRYDVRTFTASGTSAGERTFVLGPNCPITLGGEAIALDDLRPGDQVEVTFDSPDAASPTLSGVAAVRPADRSKWVIAITLSRFDDATIPPFPGAAAAVEQLRESLGSRYAVPLDQIVVLADPSRVRIEQGLPDALEKASGAGQLLVVVAGRAMSDGRLPPLVVPTDFDRQRAAGTGVLLTTILTAVENCPVENKLVLLDLQPVGGATAAAMVDAVRGTRSRPLLRTTPVFATDKAAAADLSAEAILVNALAAGVRGPADSNRDNLCTLAELNDYFAAEAAGGVRLILPETTPPRLTDDAKQAIRRIAAAVAQQRIDKTDAHFMISAADKLAPNQPEPKLVGAILLVKAREHAEAITNLEQVVARHPRTPLAWEVSAWARFEKLNYGGGISDLVQLVKNLPQGELPESERRAIPWVGRLREFCALAAAPDRKPSQAAIDALDAAIASRGGELDELYRQGRDAVRAVVHDFDRRVAATTDATEQLKLKYDRWQLRHYASFSLESAAQQAVAAMDAE